MLKQPTYCSRKWNYLQLIVASFLFSFTTSVYAQQSVNHKGKKIGTINEIYQQLSATHVNGRQAKNIETATSTLTVITEVNQPELIIGKIQGNPTSNLLFHFSEGKLSGQVIIPNQHKAYNYYSDDQSNVFVEEIDINKVICIDMPIAPLLPNAGYNVGNTPAMVPLLQSLPGATAVIMMDFDGQYVTGGRWGTINAQPSGLTEAAMKVAWDVTAEDYRPYQINVTTDEAIFQAAPKNRRKRCVVTPTNDAAPGAGGVAYISSFDNGNDGDVAWVYNLGGNGKTTGETVSHEIGHTVGLSHDGPSYYMGHANKLWAPIMGATYYVTVGQWSIGEYQDADNTEDDVTIIATQNGFTYRTDEAGNAIATAKALKIGAGGVITAMDNYGIITTRTDIDVYSFTTLGGKLTLDATPAPLQPNLDILLKLTDATGKEIVSSNPTTTLSASLTATLTKGTYYLHIDGTGVADPLTTGYTDYASIGEYTISGALESTSGINTTTNAPPSFQTYPNPTEGLVTIKIAATTDNIDIKILNSLGQVIINKTNVGSLTTVDLTDYSKGIYFILVTNRSGVASSKLIRN
jgi:hypothetical protein